MELSFAPMEGVTYCHYRRLHARLFPGADCYYAPFIAPDGKGNFKTGNLRDILPENNDGLRLIPQILCNASGPFLAVARELEALGYGEVNLNVGCPSGTVTAKHKGAGMLRDPASLDRCLEEIFSSCPLRVSIKTRMGFLSTAEFPQILRIYTRYPLSALIVHARDRAGMYRSAPDLDAFASAVEACPFPLVYNGNLFRPEDASALSARFPTLSGFMIGRGAVANPALFRQLRGGPAITAGELRHFHDALMDACLEAGLAPQHAAARMKELWFYMLSLFPGSERAGKNILRSRSLPDYQSAVDALFGACELDPSAAFAG